MTGWPDALNLLLAQGGLALRADLVDAGLARRSMQRLISAGQLVRVNDQVLALAGTLLDLAAMTRAAVMLRPELIPTGLSSAVLHGPGPWDEVALAGDPWLVGEADRAITARFLRHPGLGTARRGGMVVADPASTVIDLLRFLEPEAAARVGRVAVQRRVVTVPLLLQARARLGRHHGVRQLDEIAGILLEGTHAESEHRLVQLLREAGLSGWLANHPVRIGPRRYEIDVAFPGARLAIEVDGQAHHSDSVAFQRDRRRQNDLVAAGWTVLRFTWDDIVHRPHDVIARILAGLERASSF